MSVIMQMKWEGVTPAQYDMVMKLTDQVANPPAGLLFHSGGFLNDAIRVTDNWESADLMNDFVHNRLMPACMEAGLQGQPQVEVFPLYARLVPNPAKLA